MKHLEKSETGVGILIPHADINKFRHGLLSVLAKVKIENCDSEFKEDLKAVYELLSHLNMDRDFRKEYKELIKVS